MRAYQIPNLLQFGATVIDGPPTLVSYSSQNLIENLQSRSAGLDLKARLDDNGTLATYDTCMKTTKALMESSNHIFVLGIDLGKTYMQHAILIVEDLRSGQANSGIVDENKF